MRKTELLNKNWIFQYHDGSVSQVDLPHTWNAQDGQDGGDDYYRGICLYKKKFTAPLTEPGKRVYLEFAGVNASARVILNTRVVASHDGGYSTFRCDVTEVLREENDLIVQVDNSVNDRVYPQKADFTFYGGIYRDVRLITLDEHHFDMDYFGGCGLNVTAEVNGADGEIHVKTWHKTQEALVDIRILDNEGREVLAQTGLEALSDDRERKSFSAETTLYLPQVHLWNGLEDPYLYTCEAVLRVQGEEKDKVSTTFGVRTFYVDPEEGFFLNGRSYPLRGVCRHQDRKGIGNALTAAHHEEDMALIREIGANTVRLSHYQHDQYFYDLCDRYGLVVWAEIPYISEHMPRGRENTVSQMKELIVQNYNHPSICFWGLSNEITISTKDYGDMIDNHRMLNQMVHTMDPTRLTTLACYAVCGPFNKVAHISDLVSWNLYLGWYAPGLFLNDLWVDFFHRKYPRRSLGYSEYGCEAMPNLHSSRPRRGDHTEEYQMIYHEYLLKFIEKRPFLWATHLWNMFDFAADARNQGGEPGMNHKGLVTFDRQLKKDSFYLYKAYWSKEPFVHICGSRYTDRTEKVTKVKVCSNTAGVTLYANGEKIGTQSQSKVYVFEVPLENEVELEAVAVVGDGDGECTAVAEDCRDRAVIRRVDRPNPAYRLRLNEGKGENWV